MSGPPLNGMNLRDLKTKAFQMGISREAAELVDDSDDPHEAAVQMILLKQELLKGESESHIRDFITQAISRLDDELDRRSIRIEPTCRDDLNQYHIFSRISEIEKKTVFVEHCAENDYKRNRAMGSMVGMAVGDALGHPFEFMPTQDEPRDAYFDLGTMKFHRESNAFGLSRGQWTDDASMGLCMADSFIMRHKFDGADMRVRFWCWWNRGYNNAFRKDKTRSGSVGLGGNISKSLAELLPFAGKEDRIPPAFQATTEDAGNGSLMRFTPVALFCHRRPLAQVYDIARRSSYTTHPGIIAAEACALLGHLIVAALNLPDSDEVNAKEFLEKETQAYLQNSGILDRTGWGFDQMKELIAGTAASLSPTERCWAWRDPSLDIAGTLKARGQFYNGYPVSAGYFGSYSMDGLAMALWCVYHTTSFDEAVVRSVNLLGDADSHGSICGQLAGALYGYRAINRQFVAWLAKWDDYDFAMRALLLMELGEHKISDEEEAPRPGMMRVTSDETPKAGAHLKDAGRARSGPAPQSGVEGPPTASGTYPQGVPTGSSRSNFGLPSVPPTGSTRSNQSIGP